MFPFIARLLSFRNGSEAVRDERRTPALWVVRFRSGEYIFVEANTSIEARDGDEVRKRQEYDASRFAVTRVEAHRAAAS
ncbi:hypothetical protein AWB74_08348 [Caballeronia arvi]|uniref:Uncharacterized protein n=1 Tax=Caballeronia arvi TaxID=1777135 RepID=A0A158L3K4_9BURK|nr:hypothetical protein [Caballeronia arvi]SAL87977.1 hypothetical protein AWB74_08348 [Caballeronia arvi]